MCFEICILRFVYWTDGDRWGRRLKREGQNTEGGEASSGGRHFVKIFFNLTRSFPNPFFTRGNPVLETNIFNW